MPERYLVTVHVLDINGIYEWQGYILAFGIANAVAAACAKFNADVTEATARRV